VQQQSLRQSRKCSHFGSRHFKLLIADFHSLRSNMSFQVHDTLGAQQCSKCCAQCSKCCEQCSKCCAQCSKCCAQCSKCCTAMQQMLRTMQQMLHTLQQMLRITSSSSQHCTHPSVRQKPWFGGLYKIFSKPVRHAAIQNITLWRMFYSSCFIIL